MAQAQQQVVDKPQGQTRKPPAAAPANLQPRGNGAMLEQLRTQQAAVNGTSDTDSIENFNLEEAAISAFNPQATDPSIEDWNQQEIDRQSARANRRQGLPLDVVIEAQEQDISRSQAAWEALDKTPPRRAPTNAPAVQPQTPAPFKADPDMPEAPKPVSNEGVAMGAAKTAYNGGRCLTGSAIGCVKTVLDPVMAASERIRENAPFVTRPRNGRTYTQQHDDARAGAQLSPQNQKMEDYMQCLERNDMNPVHKDRCMAEAEKRPR